MTYTATQRLAAEELLRRRVTASLTVFKRLMYKRYEHGRHLEVLDRALEQVTRYVETGGAEGIGRLIVEMPPRHGKTITTSRLYPTWHLGRNPDHRVMLVSYGATLAHKNSRMARNLMRSPRYKATFGLELAEDSKAADAWDIADHEGGCDAMGITGGATGKGAHVLIIDDPIKNRAEAESDVYRDNIWDAYINDLYTRLEPGGAIVVIHTRWHMDDLIGRLTAREPDEWHRIRMPAIAEADDPLGRKEGEALWPWRFPLEVLKRIAKAVGDYVWAALYQQRPTPAEGGIIKRKSLLDHLVPSIPAEQIERAVRFWDLAMSSKTSADYTASVKYGMGFDGRRKLLDARKEQLDWADVTEYLAQTALEDGPDVIIGIEEKGYMSRAVQDLVQDTRLQSYAIFGYPAHTDKLTRGLPFAAKVGAGVVDILEAHWTWNLIDELCAFPNGTHDDWWDAAAGAETMLDQGGLVLGGMVDATAAGALVGAY
jgi:predicted phage terminase large subunit-like protein